MGVAHLGLAAHLHFAQWSAPHLGNLTVASGEAGGGARAGAAGLLAGGGAREGMVGLLAAPWLPLPLLIAFTIFYNLGLGSLSWSLPRELLPPPARPAALAIISAVSNLLWFIVTKTFHDIQQAGTHIMHTYANKSNYW